MIVISEFLPNPTGRDAEGEWVELFNAGPQEIDLRGWVLKDASGRSFELSGRLAPKKFLLLDYKTTKIVLNNDGETLFLYDREGRPADKADYAGAAIEGESVARKEQGFIFTSSPTPGKENAFEISPAEQVSPAGAPAPDFGEKGQANLAGFDFFLLAIAGSFLSALATTLVLKKIYAEKNS